jgi:hypothetical protein
VPAWRAMVGGLLAALLVAGCGAIPDPERQARDAATDRVRTRALRFGTEVWAGLRATDAAGAAEVVRRSTRLLGGFDGPGGGGSAAGVLATEVGDGGAVRLDLAFRDQADAGGGLSYTQATVLLCVRLTGAPGPAGEVRLADLACPPALVEPGVVDQVVTLAREGPPPAPAPPRAVCLSGGDNDECVGG